MKKKVLPFFIGLATGIACILLIFFWNKNAMTKIHRLKAPLILASNTPTKNLHLLPAGTTLYYDSSFPEGFTRYKVYINIDRMPLALVELDDPTEIDPIDARPLDKSDLIKALRDYPLTRTDLEAILNSKQLSKQEIQEVLTLTLAKADSEF